MLIPKETQEKCAAGGGKYLKFAVDVPVKCKLLDYKQVKANNPDYADDDGMTNQIEVLLSDGKTHKFITSPSASTLIRGLINVQASRGDVVVITKKENEQERSYFEVKKHKEGDPPAEAQKKVPVVEGGEVNPEDIPDW